MWGAIGAIGAGLLGFGGGERANAANARQAAAQMAFQERMAGSQFQRGVEDMRKAGLNPALAYQQGGASAPTGASAQMDNSLGAGGSSAIQAAQAYASIAATGAQIAKTEAETKQVDLATRTAEMQVGWQNAILKNRSDRDAAITQLQAHPDYIILLRKKLEADLRMAQTNARQGELQIPAMENMSRAANTWWGRYIAPFMGDAGNAARILQAGRK